MNQDWDWRLGGLHDKCNCVLVDDHTQASAIIDGAHKTGEGRGNGSHVCSNNQHEGMLLLENKLPMLWQNVFPVDGIDVLLLLIIPSAPFLVSLEVADIELGTIHDTGLISIWAYNFVCPANVPGPGVRTTTAKTFQLRALVRLLAGCILTVVIKSMRSDTWKGGGASSGLGSGGKELFAALLINSNYVKDVANLVFSLD
jgi:hypothetical protein